MKAIKILKEYRNIDFGCDVEQLHSEINEAIAELEELQNRSCESCKECVYLGVDTDICLKCSHSYASKFKRIKNANQNTK